METISPKQAFMASFHEATQEIEGESLKRSFNSVVLELVPSTGKPDFEMGENEVYLSDMNTPVLRQKLGTKAMDMMTSLADRFGIHIVLHASAYDKREDTPDTYELIGFYKKYGFFKCGSNDMMTRQPKGPAGP